MKRSWLSLSSVTLLALCGCQAILGFEELEPAGAGNAGSSGSSGGPSTTNHGSAASGVACDTGDDCAEDLACLYGFCRPACSNDTQCDQGSVCLWSDTSGGCRLASEKCEDGSCDNADLVCGIDGTCRVACSNVDSCEANTQRCIAGTCVSTVGEDSANWHCGAAEDGQVACNEGVLSVCNVTAPGLDGIEDCGGIALCDRSLPTDPTYDPESPPACAMGCPAGEPYCDGSTLLICEDDGSGPVDAGEPCASEALCAGAETAGETVCRPPLCAANEARCGGGQTELWLQRCAVGRHRFEDTDECTGATAQCNPGASACFTLEMDPTEVTVAKYTEWLATAPATTGQPKACELNTSFAQQTDCLTATAAPNCTNCNQPVVCIDWCDAHAYCEAHSQHLCGKIGGGMNPYDRHDDAGSSEWMNACTAGGQFEWSSGAAPGMGECIYSGSGFSEPYAAGTRAGCTSPSPGYRHLFDLSGNVEEWEDSCEKAADAAAATPNDACRTRGGSLASDRNGTRCDAVPASAWKRSAVSPTLGFRCCG